MKQTDEGVKVIKKLRWKEKPGLHARLPSLRSAWFFFL
jgi:hypothetical protein